MIPQIFGTSKCKETKKTILFFKERGIQHQFIDLKEKALSPGEWKSIFRHLPVDQILDKESSFWKNNGYNWKIFSPEEEMSLHHELIRTPLVRHDQGVSAGYAPDVWKTWLK